MLAALARPLPPLRLLFTSLAICAGIALYCLAYTALAGRAESAAQALGWALVNVFPWLLAVEAAKRPISLHSALAIIAAAFAASLFLGFIWAGEFQDWAFEATRRLPALALTSGLAFFLRRTRDRQSLRSAPVDLPLSPREIEWVSAAGNYIEIRKGAQIWLRRGSLSSLERELARHGFVRIHRSLLVRRDRIARIRPADVILHDGTSLKTGKRYRSSLRG
jgi:DNA-binding LytR/AlgR family response regulator